MEPRALFRIAVPDASALRRPFFPAPPVWEAARKDAEENKVMVTPNPSSDPLSRAIRRNFQMGEC